MLRTHDLYLNTQALVREMNILLALEYLDKDREFLTRGGVFTDDWINSYIDLKMEEVTKMRMTPHPIEFGMYYSC